MTGCGLKILDGCTAGEGYTDIQTAGAKDKDSIDIGSASELKSRLPIGYFELYGKFKANDRWTLDYVFGNSKKAKGNGVVKSQVPAQCADATHYMSRIMLGAYRLRSAAAKECGACVNFAALRFHG